MREGSLDAPTRHAIAWQDPAFYDEAKLEAELGRVFDICHGCRRCFNLCDSFPRLFELIDNSPTQELDGVKREDFKQVVDACTLCDMCFMTKCPYVPPHEFNLDFPHLMLRYRAVAHRRKATGFLKRQLARTDRNGTLARHVAPLANWAAKAGNKLTRPLMEKAAGIDRRAALPKFNAKTFMMRAKTPMPLDARAPAASAGRKAVIYATCFANYNEPEIGVATRAVLAKLGVETEVAYPQCCGMPQLEQGEVARVAASARAVAAALLPYIDKGFDVVAPVPSCALMLKFEWRLIVPDDPAVAKLAKATFDVSEYVVDIAKRHGLPEGLGKLDGGVALHIACHARAQNMGHKAAEMLRLIPGADVQVIERCSGHGGAWGVMKGNFDVALKIGRPVARQAAQSGKTHIASECPLAGAHIVQGMALQGTTAGPPVHPIQLFARAFGLL